MTPHTQITALQLNKIVAVDVEEVNSPNNPTPVPATNSQVNPDSNFNNTNWNTFGMQQGSPQVVVSSLIDNPGTSPIPATSSPQIAPFTNDPAIFFSTARHKKTFKWPDGSWREVDYDDVQYTENLFYGTGPLYENAGGFGNNQNSGGIGPGQTYNASPFNPPIGFALVPSNSSTGR